MNFAEELNRHPIFAQVSKSSRTLGIESYVVGGFVRDLLLGRPSVDIDFVCIGSGIRLAEEVAHQLGGVKVTVFKKFGVARIGWHGYDLEFVGARKESYRRDSRKPYVEDGSLEDDQHRRDFTINALAINLNEHNWGEIIDPFGGMQDLQKKNIRTPLLAGRTFSDDPLRMMRAVRFASQLGFDIEASAFEAMRKHADRLRIVSMERITSEMNKIIMSSRPSYGFKLLYHSGLLKRFFPEMAALQGVEYIDNKTHKDNFYHTLQVLDNVSDKSDDLWLRWAAILHDIAKPLTKHFDPHHGWTFHGHEDKGARMVPMLFRKMRLPMRDNMLFVQKLVRLHLRPIVLAREVTDSAVRRLLFEAGDAVEALMILCRADITSKNQDKAARYLKNFDRVEKKMQEVEKKDTLRCFQPPISGEDIMRFFDVPPSPIVGEIKEQIKNAILDGKIKNNKEEAYRLMVSFAKRKGLEPVENNI